MFLLSALQEDTGELASVGALKPLTCVISEKSGCVQRAPQGSDCFCGKPSAMAVMAGRAALRRAGKPGAIKLKDDTNIPLGGPWLSSEEHCNDSEPETQEISGVIFESCLGCRVTAQGRRACCKHSMGNRSKAERISNNSKHPLWEKSKLGCPLWLLFVWGNLVVFLNQ